MVPCLTSRVFRPKAESFPGIPAVVRRPAACRPPLWTSRDIVRGAGREDCSIAGLSAQGPLTETNFVNVSQLNALVIDLKPPTFRLSNDN